MAKSLETLPLSSETKEDDLLRKRTRLVILEPEPPHDNSGIEEWLLEKRASLITPPHHD